jgi:soluble lytic murein transglycosylase-like protein
MRVKYHMNNKALTILGALLCSGCQTVDPNPITTPLKGSKELHQIVEEKAKANKVPPKLALALVQYESKFDPKAYHTGNYGLGQIRCSTAREMGKIPSCASLFDPNINMMFSMKYLSKALVKADNDWCHAVTLYSKGLFYKKSKRTPYCEKIMKTIKDPK